MKKAGRQNRNRQNRVPIKIKYKLLGCILIAIILVMTTILFLTYNSTAAIIRTKSEELLRSENEKVTKEAIGWIDATLARLDAERDSLQYFSLSHEEIVRYMRHTAGQSEAYPAGIYLGLTTGELLHASFVPEPGYVASEQSWYKEGLSSENFTFGTVYFDNDSQAYVVGAAGVYKSRSGAVLGVVAADIYLDAISSLIRDIQIEETGETFLVEVETDIIIGHRDSTLIGEKLSDFSDGLYSHVDSVLKERGVGLSTCTTDDMGRVNVQVNYVEGSNWAIVSYVPQQEIFKDLNGLTQSLVIIAVCAGVALLLMVSLVIRFVIDRPLRQMQRVVSGIASGNLNQKISYHSNDEFGLLIDKFGLTVDRLRSYMNYINEIAIVLNEIAVGKLDFKLQYDYSGDFAHIRQALEHIAKSLNRTLCQINQAAKEVSYGAAQIASGSYALSQGTSEQAGSVQELVLTINEISDQVQNNAQDARFSSQKAEQLGVSMAESSSQMQYMVEAMGGIQKSSGKIANIIKVIEDIAYQTNILALNASIEASRAGSAGKGFAVVADEVRSLATKSQEATQDTADLIEETIAAIENGGEIVGETAKSLQFAVGVANEMEEMVGRISNASSAQAASIVQVTRGLDQISHVVQMNSATAQEAAAASEELSGQAQLLKELVGQFTLKDDEVGIEAEQDITVRSEVDYEADHDFGSEITTGFEPDNDITSFSLNP